MISKEAERCEGCRRPKQEVLQKLPWIDVCVMAPGIVLDICGRESQEFASVLGSFDRIRVLPPANRAGTAANADPVNDHDGSEAKQYGQDPGLEVETHGPLATSPVHSTVSGFPANQLYCGRMPPHP